MVTPSHPALLVDGKPVTFQHLEPLRLDVPVHDRTLTVDVRFANHCYTCAFDPDQHDRSRLVTDGANQRAFDRVRYEASHRLPGIVHTMARASVWQTRHERNFVYALLNEGTGDDAYPLFFTVKRGRTADIAVFVERAYPKPWSALRPQIRSAAKVRFSLLCDRVFKGQQLRFHRIR